jgi:hypothetical protein
MADMRVTGRNPSAIPTDIPSPPIVPPASQGRRDGRVVFWAVPTTGRETADFIIGRAMASEAIPTFARSSGLLFAVLRDLAAHGSRGHLHGVAVALSEALAKGGVR